MDKYDIILVSRYLGKALQVKTMINMQGMKIKPTNKLIVTKRDADLATPPENIFIGGKNVNTRGRMEDILKIGPRELCIAILCYNMVATIDKLQFFSSDRGEFTHAKMLALQAWTSLAVD